MHVNESLEDLQMQQLLHAQLLSSEIIPVAVYSGRGRAMEVSSLRTTAGQVVNIRIYFVSFSYIHVTPYSGKLWRGF